MKLIFRSLTMPYYILIQRMLELLIDGISSWEIALPHTSRKDGFI